MIYAFGIWRLELDRLSEEIALARSQLNDIQALKPHCSRLKSDPAYVSLWFSAQDRLFKGFLLSSLIMRKMDDAAASRPFPAGKMTALKVDRQLKMGKRLCAYSFDNCVGVETETDIDGEKSIQPEEYKEFSGRDVTNLAVHSKEMRTYSPPDSEDEGFWIRSDQKPVKGDSKRFWFLDLEEFGQMLDDFRSDPWKDRQHVSNNQTH